MLDAVTASCTHWTLKWGQEERKLAMARLVPICGQLGKDGLCPSPTASVIRKEKRGN